MNLNSEDPKRFIGCCGAYCKTCKSYIEKFCKGCKLGYNNKNRNINRSKCSMKICCFKEKLLETCADCSDYSKCKIINNFYSKNGYKYKKYKQAIDFIRNNGYCKFFKLADNWKNPYGKFS